MVADYSKAENDLGSVAEENKIALPTTLDSKDQETYDHLSKLRGEAFDLMYSREMAKDHETDLAEYRREAADGNSSEIKGFASQMLLCCKIT
jgi:predicted outer membrane protein